MGIYEPGDGDRFDRLLDATEPGWLIRSGTLRDRPLGAYLDPDERPRFVLTNRIGGVVYERFGERTRVEAGLRYSALAVLTDRRVVLAVGADPRSDRGDRLLWFPYTDVASVVSDRDRLSGELAFRMAQGGRLRFPVREGDDLEPVERYVADLGVAWAALERAAHSTGGAVAEVRSTMDAGLVDRAERLVEAAEQDVSEARETLATTGTADLPAVATAFDRIETDLARARRDYRLGVAGRAVATAHDLADEGDYEAAADAYARAADATRRAEEIAADAGVDPCDAPERAARIDRHLDRLASLPLERARRREEQADAVGDVDRRIDILEDALDAYRECMRLDWGREQRRFEGDPDDIAERIEGLVSDLIDRRWTAARRHIGQGNWHREAGDRDEAVEEYGAALDHLQRALELTREFRSGDIEAVAEELATVEELIGRADAGEAG